MFVISFFQLKPLQTSPEGEALLSPLVILTTVGRKNLTSTWMSTRSFAGAQDDNTRHNRMGFPQEIGTQDDNTCHNRMDFP